MLRLWSSMKSDMSSFSSSLSSQGKASAVALPTVPYARPRLETPQPSESLAAAQGYDRAGRNRALTVPKLCEQPGGRAPARSRAHR